MIKVFEPFENVSKPSISVNAMMISYGYVYKRSSKPVMKSGRVGEKTGIFRSVFKLTNPYHNLHQYLFPKP